MNELLEELFKNNILSEDTQKELKEALESTINEAVESAKEDARNEIRVELTEQWIEQRDQLIEALDMKVDALVNAEVTELRDDIEKFRDLEVEYAEKLTEAQAAMAEEFKADVAELLEKLDSFLEIRLAVEFGELKEELDAYKKNDFGSRIVEAFGEEFLNHFVDEDSIQAELAATKAELEETKAELEETAAERESMIREAKLHEVLSNLDAHQREVMSSLLDKVSTNKIEETYAMFLPRIMKESVNTSEKENKVLAEGVEEKGKIIEESVKSGESVIISGDKPLNESEEDLSTKPKLSEAARSMLQKLGGVK